MMTGVLTETAATFESLKREGRKALIPYFTGGYPSLKASERLIRLADDSGASLIEIGLPFSDPVADGPTIQRASFKALQNGVTVSKILAMVERVSVRTKAPLLLMGYYNPMLAFGLKRLTQTAANCGVAGLIIPDLPPDEATDMISATQKAGISLNFLVAPTSSEARIALADRRSTGFVYAVTVAGVTGARSGHGPETLRYLRRVRRIAQNPVVAGFGVASVDSARALAKNVDGVVIGSALLDLLDTAGSSSDFSKVRRFLQNIRDGLDRT